MNIAVGTAFRDAPQNQITRFFSQIRALALFLGTSHSVRVHAVEGDSKDDTAKRIVNTVNNRLNLVLTECSHGGPRFGSTDPSKGFRAFSKVGNAIFDGVVVTDDVFVYIESDLNWSPSVISELIDDLAKGEYDILSPLTFAETRLHNSRGFRKDGTVFFPFLPYHPELALQGITEVDGAENCLVMRQAVAKKIRMTDGAFPEWCEIARSYGFRIGVDVDSRIYHP